MCRLRVFCLPGAQKFAEDVAHVLNIKSDGEFNGLSQMNLMQFANGESCVDIPQSVRGDHVYIIGWATGNVDALLTQFLIAVNAVTLASAERVIAVWPMMPFSRQDRKDKSRRPITSRLVATLLEAAGVHQVITMDLHADQIQGFFSIPCDNLYARRMFCDHLVATGLPNLPIAVVSPDVGGTARARAMMKVLKPLFTKHEFRLCIIHKERDAPGLVKTMTIVGDVSGCHCILVDDIGDTCGTLCKATEALDAAGANCVRAVLTHGVFSLDAMNKLTACAPLHEVVVTNTCLASAPLNKVTVLSAGSVFARAIWKSYNNESISSLFE